MLFGKEKSGLVLVLVAVLIELVEQSRLALLQEGLEFLMAKKGRSKSEMLVLEVVTLHELTHCSPNQANCGRYLLHYVLDLLMKDGVGYVFLCQRHAVAYPLLLRWPSSKGIA